MPSSQPNLLFVFPDQMRGSALGFLGQEPVRTPVLDGFARESLVLTSAASNWPVCSPYRASLMTGQYPHRNGVLSNCNTMHAPYGVELRADARCWSDILKLAGYSLGYIGKWHLDSPHAPYIDCKNNHGENKWNEWCPPERRHGFDYWYAYGTYDYHLRPMYWKGDAPRDGFHYVDQWGPEHEADLAIEYLRNTGGRFRDPEKPFALVVSMNPPHMPYDQVPERYQRSYRDADVEGFCRAWPNVPPAGTQWGDYFRKHIRNQWAMIGGVDEQFGRILGALKDAGLDENTLAIFTSDHGDCLGMHGLQAKTNIFEPSMHVPFMARFPGRIAPRSDGLLLSAPDLYPTMLDLLGFGGRIPAEVQGQSHARIFTGGEGPRPASQLFLKLQPAQPAGGQRGLRTDRYTYLVDREGPAETVSLYDRAADPHQLRNVAEDHPETVRALHAEMHGWLDRTGDPWPRNA